MKPEIIRILAHIIFVEVGNNPFDLQFVAFAEFPHVILKLNGLMSWRTGTAGVDKGKCLVMAFGFGSSGNRMMVKTFILRRRHQRQCLCQKSQHNIVGAAESILALPVHGWMTP